jgi:UDP-glucose 4-epimerase
MSSDPSPVLVTGGAGYIGSHVARLLTAAARKVVIYDNLSTGHAWAALDSELVVGDLGDRERLAALFAERRFAAVLHFAAHIWVGESVREPAKYYRNNLRSTCSSWRPRRGSGTWCSRRPPRSTASRRSS